MTLPLSDTNQTQPVHPISPLTDTNNTLLPRICLTMFPDEVNCYGYTGMHRITTFRSTKDRIYDGGPIILYYCVTTAHSIQYSNMLHRFVA